MPSRPSTVAWSIQPPAEFDRRDFSALELRLVVRGVNALHGWIAPNASHLRMPTYEASFDRRVDVALDGDAFATATLAATLSDDLTTWSASVPAPAPGAHTIFARAVQGATPSVVMSRAITVTE